VAFNAQGVMNLLAFLSVLLFVPETQERKSKQRKPAGYRPMLKSGVMKGLLSYRVIFEMSMMAVTTFLPIYCAIRLGMDKTQVGILIAVNMIGVSLLQIVTGRITDRFNKRTLVTWGGVGTFVLLALMVVADSFWMLLVLMALRAVSSSFSMPAIAGLSVTQGRKFGMGAVQSIMGLATSAGDAIGPVVAGLVNDAWDVTAVFYFAAGIGVCGTIIFNWFMRDYVQPPKPVMAQAGVTTPSDPPLVK
jgi:DHA1 family quinolone resistance protein-like MFS transporter